MVLTATTFRRSDQSSVVILHVTPTGGVGGGPLMLTLLGYKSGALGDEPLASGGLNLQASPQPTPRPAAWD